MRLISPEHRGSKGIAEEGLFRGCLRLDAGVGCWLRPNCSCSKAAAGKMNLYESFAQATQLGDLHTCLMMDMKACQEDDVRLLCHLTPSIYTEVSVSGGIPLGQGNCAGRADETAHLRVQPLLAAAGCFFPAPHLPPSPPPIKG